MRACRYAAASGERASVSVLAAAGETVELLARVHRRFGEAVPGVGDQAWLRGGTIAGTCWCRSASRAGTCSTGPSP